MNHRRRRMIGIVNLNSVNRIRGDKPPPNGGYPRDVIPKDECLFRDVKNRPG